MFKDFEYDGVKLSSKGMIIGNLGDKGWETVVWGSPIVFEKVPMQYGKKYEVTNSKYDEVLTSSFQIFIDPCRVVTFEDEYLTVKKLMDLNSWLNRRGYKKMKLIGDKEYLDIFFMAQINTTILRIDGKIYGLELQIDTLNPYALMEERTITLDANTVDSTLKYKNESQDEGFLYPNEVEITCKQAGDLKITSIEENRLTSIVGCSVNEVITMNYPLITTTSVSHQLQNAFNWNFIRLPKEYNKTDYSFNFNLSATMVIKYNPVVKMGF